MDPPELRPIYVTREEAARLRLGLVWDDVVPDAVIVPLEEIVKLSQRALVVKK